MSEALAARDLGKAYWDGDRTLQILKNISLSIEKGSGVAILGPSGSGKTTLLNLLSGLDAPSEGEVRIGGVLLNTLGEEAKARLRNEKIGFVFQFYHLLSEFTALENVMLPMLMRKNVGAGETRSRAENLLERVGLKDRQRHFPNELSGGEQQRVAIARSLMNDPEILFCDEPTGNLDLKMGMGIAEILRDLHARERKTVVVVTHDERIAKMADKIWSLVKCGWEN